MRLSPAQREYLLQHARGVGDGRVSGGHLGTIHALERMGLIRLVTDGPEPMLRATYPTPLGLSTIQAILETEAV